MVKELSTEQGSAGIEMVILSGMLMVFILLPLICFIFEVYIYGLHGLRWMNGTENALDALEWQLQTPALSQVERRVAMQTYSHVLKEHFDKLIIKEAGENYMIEKLSLLEAEPPVLLMQLRVNYTPSTMVGALAARSGKLSFLIEIERELPCDR